MFKIPIKCIGSGSGKGAFISCTMTKPITDNIHISINSQNIISPSGVTLHGGFIGISGAL